MKSLGVMKIREERKWRSRDIVKNEDEMIFIKKIINGIVL